jgi:hypothetical protein
MYIVGRTRNLGNGLCEGGKSYNKQESKKVQRLDLMVDEIEVERAHFLRITVVFILKFFQLLLAPSKCESSISK